MKFVLLYLIILKIFNIVNSSTNFSTMSAFLCNILYYKNISSVLFFTCFDQYDNVRLSKIMNELYIYSNIYKADYLQELNYEAFGGKINWGFVVDLSCNNYEKILYEMAVNYSLYESPYKWLILDRQNQVLMNSSSLIKAFTNIPLRMDSDVMAVLFNLENTVATLYDIYNPGFNRTEMVHVIQKGFWTPNSFVFTYTVSKYEQRKNLTGTVVKCAIVKTHMDATTSIDEYYHHRTTKNYDTINKLSYSLFIHLHEIHNFSIDLTVTEKWFGGAEGGIDEGLAKLLYEKQADLGISAGLLKVDRIPVVDFVAPAYPFRTCFIFRNPGISKKVQNEFLKPFEPSLWVSIVGCVLLFCIVLKCTLVIERLLKNDSEENSWAEACLLIWAVFCQQGATFVPKPTSGRCTLLSLLLMSLLLYNYYTSSIVSSLLSDLPPPIETIQELSNSNLEVGVEDTVYTRTLFEVTQDPRIKFLYNHKVAAHSNKPSYMNVEDGIARVKAGGFAYHTEPTVGYPIIKSTFEPHEICDLAEINVFTPTTLWVIAQKRSQYKKMFAIGYQKMLEAGIISRQKSVWLSKKPDCLANTHLVQVGIQHLSSAFLILLLGILISTGVLILEIFLHRCKKIHKSS